ncbi:MAG: hypothetical protein KBT63_05695 [Porticoccaceae bacterium]|nr:hypothetical protein [Porticoccaceae bacterium]
MDEYDGSSHIGLVIDVADGSEPNIKNFDIDRRCNRPNSIYSEDAEKIVTYFKTFDASISDHDVTLALPNEISISLSILERSWSTSVRLKKDITDSIKKDKSSITKDRMEIYFDYVEQIYMAIIFSYKAVESFCNASIPDDYEYKITNQRGVTEIYSKPEIERWIKTSDKLTKILPGVYECEKPQKKEFWSDFKELENIRNKIVHSKSKATEENFIELITKDMEPCVFSSMRVLEYFFDKNPSNEYIPLGYGGLSYRYLKVKAFSEIIKPHSK